MQADSGMVIIVSSVSLAWEITVASRDRREIFDRRFSATPQRGRLRHSADVEARSRREPIPAANLRVNPEAAPDRA
jgi:hypothetical protein